MLTADLVYKRDVLRRRLGTELGDQVFREWLERSLAAVTPAPAQESAVAEPERRAQDAASSKARQKAIAPTPEPVTAPETFSRGEASKKPATGADRPGPAIRATTQRERVTRRWTAEEVSTLYKLHGEGLTPQAIADRLGRSKRSVIGCADRHDLKFGRRRTEPETEPSGMRAAHGPAENVTPAEPGAGAIAAELESDAPDSGPASCAPCNGCDTHSPAEAGPDDDVPPEPQAAPRGGCLWMEGEPGNHTWCGAERSPGRSYCPEHCVRAFVPSGGGRFPLERFHSPPPQERAA